MAGHGRGGGGRYKYAGSTPGQILVLVPLLVLFFVLLAAVLIDVYHLEEARNWGYGVAQNAALAGVSLGRDWHGFEATPDTTHPTPTPRPDHCVEPGQISLNSGVAQNQAESFLIREMALRGITDYLYEVRVFPLPTGSAGDPSFPPLPVRLGAGRGYWRTSNPAVGIYLTFNVRTFFMSIVGRSSVTIHVFGSAEVAQPVACPTPTL